MLNGHAAKRMRTLVPGAALAILVTSIMTAPLQGAQNEHAVVSLSSGEFSAPVFGDTLIFPADRVSPGDHVEVTLSLDEFEVVRAVEAHISYDPAGFTYIGWERSPALERALEVGPTHEADISKVRIAIAFIEEDGRPYEGRLEVGRAEFEVKDPARARMLLSYVELVDTQYHSDKFKLEITPLNERPLAVNPLESGEYRGRTVRDLGDGVWWTEATPNPFDVVTRLSFSVPDSMWVKIDVLDRTGHVVRPLVDHPFKGRYSTLWTADDFAGNQVAHGNYELAIDVEGRTDRQPLRYVPKSEMPPDEHGHHQ